MSAYDYYDKKSMIYMYCKNRWINDKNSNSGTVKKVCEPLSLSIPKRKPGQK